jgi:flagellar basal-body rod modification protein FlgD
MVCDRAIESATGIIGPTQPGVPRTANFTVSGDTTITATVVNSTDTVVRNLGTFPVTAPDGNTAVTWDGRDDSGNLLPDGTYTLKIVSTDPSGNTTSAAATITLDGTPPTIVPVTQSPITPQRAWTVSVADASSGVASATIWVNGTRLGTIHYAGNLLAGPPQGR